MVGVLPRQAVTVLRLCVVAAVLALPAVGTATPEPLRPAPGETVRLGAVELEFVVRDDPAAYQPPLVEISDSAEVDEEGHFRDEPLEIVGTEAVDEAGTYAGRAEGAWLAQAGTYWWKAYGEACTVDPVTDDEACSEVVTAPRRLDVVERVLALRLGGADVQRIGRDRPLVVTVRCDDPCTATVTGALWRGGGTDRAPVRGVALDPVTLTLDGDRPRAASWRLRRADVETIRRVTASGVPVSLVVTADAEADEAIGRATTTFEARLTTSAASLRRRTTAAGRVRPRSLRLGRAARLVALRWRTWGGPVARGTGRLVPRGPGSRVRVRLTGRRACRGALRYGAVHWPDAGGVWRARRLPGRCD